MVGTSNVAVHLPCRDGISTLTYSHFYNAALTLRYPVIFSLSVLFVLSDAHDKQRFFPKQYEVIDVCKVDKVCVVRDGGDL